MADELIRFLLNLDTSSVREEELEGAMHWVIPTAILGDDQVIEGNDGAYLYPGAENAKSADLWNHMPIVADHPKEGDKFVSARSPEWLNARKVGLMLNSHHDDGRLWTESWLNQERTKKIDIRIYNAVKAKQQMEVSTGLKASVQRTPGKKGGKAYKGRVHSYKPDHLAILPDKAGAFSIAMGGGLFANQAAQPEGEVTVLQRAAMLALEPLGIKLTANEVSFSDITSQLSAALAAKLGEPGQYWRGYICDVFKDWCVYRTDADYRSDTLWMVEYKVANDAVTLTTEPVQVQRSTTYKEVTGSRTYVRNESGGLSVLSPDPVPDPKETEMAFNKKDHITALISNGVYAEGDRAELEKMPDGILEKIKVPVAVSPPPPPAPVLTNTQPANQPAAKLTREELLALMPPDWVAVHNQGQKALTQRRTQLIGIVKASPNNAFTDQALSEMDIDNLAAIANLAKGTATPAQDPRFLEGFDPSQVGVEDYSGQAAPLGVVVTNAAGPGEADGLDLPKMKWE